MQKWSDIVLILILLPISLFSKISVSNYRQEGAKVRQIRGLRKSSEIKRPSLPKTHQTKNFTFHYTLTGPDSISKVDKDDNSIPDYIDSAATAAEYSYDLLLDSLGYSPPPLQNQRVDVYLYNLEYPTWGYPTQNEKVKTTSREYDYYSSMNIENDFQGEYGLGKYEAVKITIAHEFYHIVQLGYNYFESGELPGQKYGDTYFLEWSSTWFEDVAYPQVNHYDYQLFNEFFNSAQEPLWTYRYRYSLSTFLKYLSNDFGINLITKIWESIKKGNQAFYALKEVLLEETGKRLAWHWNKFFRSAYYSGSRYQPKKAICTDARYFSELNIDTSYHFSDSLNFNSNINSFSTRFYKITFDETENFFIESNKNAVEEILSSYILDSKLSEDKESQIELINNYYFGDVPSNNDCIIFATNSKLTKKDYSFNLIRNSPPSKFELNFPLDSSNVSSLKPSFSWNEANDSKKDSVTYSLFLGDSISGTRRIYQGKKTEYRLDFKLKDNTKYYWYVKAWDRGNLVMKNSDGYNTFIVSSENKKPTQFKLFRPKNNDTETKDFIILNWESSSDIDNYRIKYAIFLGTSRNLSTPIDTTQKTFYKIDNLQEDTTYFWRVVAFDASGGITYSDWDSFYVNRIHQPSKIVNLYPNPIDPSLKNHIAVEIKTDSRNNNLTLALFNILGQKVKGHKYILPQKSHGTRVYQFPISRSLASGVYIIRCQTGRDVDTRKITILK